MSLSFFAIRIDNDDYGVVLCVGPHIGVVILIGPSHQVSESVIPRFDGIFFRVAMVKRRFGELKFVKVQVLCTSVKPIFPIGSGWVLVGKRGAIREYFPCYLVA